jgi:uncharacterized protein with FMN-binding domain
MNREETQMKKILSVVLATSMIFALAACSSSSDSKSTEAATEAAVVTTEAQTEEVANASAVVAGEYTASSYGMESYVEVTATIDENGVITALEIDASGETDSLGQVAAPKLQAKILEAGTIEGIDAISGCTMTSNAIFTAINDIYAQAGVVTE